MTCSAYWSQQVKVRILSRWPDTEVMQARVYGSDRVLTGGHTVAGVVPDRQDPIKHMKAILRAADRPQDLILMYHPRGGVSVYDKKKPPRVDPARANL